MSYRPHNLRFGNKLTTWYRSGETKTKSDFRFSTRGVSYGTDVSKVRVGEQCSVACTCSHGLSQTWLWTWCLFFCDSDCVPISSLKELIKPN